jgi:carbon-monoxide dehydrogenase large subunit
MGTVHRTLSVGAPLARLEDERFLRGEAQYVGDLRVPGMLHAAFVRSIAAHARVVAIDASGALALTGVHAVLTGDDTAELDDFPLVVRTGEEVVREMHPVLARGEVRYVGQPVALVVAETPELAADAAELVAVELEELPLADGKLLLRWHGSSGD